MKNSLRVIRVVLLSVLLAVSLISFSYGSDSKTNYGSDDEVRSAEFWNAVAGMGEPDMYVIDVNMGCLVSVKGYDKVRKREEGKYKSHTFSWYCTSYQGLKNVSVDITFSNGQQSRCPNKFSDSDCLTFQSTYLSEGICSK